MLDVASLSHFDFFNNFTLYAGKGGLYKTLSNVVVLDHEGYEEDFSDFSEGDFVLTSLFYAKDNPDLVFNSFQKLIDIGVCAVAIKSLYYKELPSEVIDLFNQSNTPIFFFHSIYIEDVILNITDYLRSATNYNHYELLIDQMMDHHQEDRALYNLLADYAYGSNNYVTSCYCAYDQTMDDISIQRRLNKLLHRKESQTFAKRLFIMKYKKGLLLVLFEPQSQDSAKIPIIWDDIFYHLHLTSSNFILGISDHLLPVHNVDVSILQALNAYDAAQKNHQTSWTYSMLTLENIIFPLKKQRYALTYFETLHQQILIAAGNKSTTIIETLITYVKHHCSIDATADLLYQHPNTIRYRLANIKKAMGIKDDFTFQMMALLMVETLGLSTKNP